MKAKYFLLILLLTSFFELSAKVLVQKDIPYRENSTDVRNLLDVYYPENTEEAKDVLVFIHGGSWSGGKKDIYWWLGKNMARKNVVSVIINYSLSPESQYEKMASDCAVAIKWVRYSIARYGGRADRIFVMGHSAGGHLAALINNDPRFFEAERITNPIKGVILNDSFGLDMYEYLAVAEPDKHTEEFLNAFSRDQETWKTASPMYYLQNVMKPFLVVVVDWDKKLFNTTSKRLYDELLKANKSVELKYIERKRHKGMIIQMISKKNQLYDFILEFMGKGQ